ncbi:MAG: hypothetical protein LQ342_008153 [Letrouitia transgressa]|nr:MAG: hypothetical protein LQ342_008153 [Letrouitia transgressa]
MASETSEEPPQCNNIQLVEPETKQVMLSSELVTRNRLDKKPNEIEDKGRSQRPRDVLLEQRIDMLEPNATAAARFAVQGSFYQPIVLPLPTPPWRSVHDPFLVESSSLSKVPNPIVKPPILYDQAQANIVSRHQRGKKQESWNLPNIDNETVALSDQICQLLCEIETMKDSKRQQTRKCARTASYPASTTFFHVPPSLTHRQVHLQDILQQYRRRYNRLVVSAFIFSQGGRLLLLRRSKNKYKAFPFCHDLPGGRVNGKDPTVLHSVSREVFEETGLRVRRIVREIGNGIAFTTPYDKAADGQRWWLKLGFIAEVQEIKKTKDDADGLKQEDEFPPVKLNPREHCEWYWALKEDVQTALAENALGGRAGTGELMLMNREQGEAMLEAFTRHEGAASSADQEHESLEG